VRQLLHNETVSSYLQDNDWCEYRKRTLAVALVLIPKVVLLFDVLRELKLHSLIRN